MFSWNQSRFNLTGWFGTGAALEEFVDQYPEDFDFLKRMAQQWSFLKYSLIQIETNLLNTDPEIMKSFAALVADASTQESLMKLVLSDYQNCQQQVANLMGASIEDRRTTRLENNRLRGEALAMLHQIQIQSIKDWRGLKEKSPEEAEAMLPMLLLLVNALAGGLKSTG